MARTAKAKKAEQSELERLVARCAQYGLTACLHIVLLLSRVLL